MAQTFKWLLRFPAKCVVCSGDMPKGDWCWRDPDLGRGRQFWHLTCTAPAGSAPLAANVDAKNSLRTVVSTGGGIFSTTDGNVWTTCAYNGCICHTVGGTFHGEQHADGTKLTSASQRQIDAASQAYQAKHGKSPRKPMRKALPIPGAAGTMPGGDPDPGRSNDPDDGVDAQASGQDQPDDGAADADAQDAPGAGGGGGDSDKESDSESKSPPPPDDPITAMIKKIAGQLDTEQGKQIDKDLAQVVRKIQDDIRKVAAQAAKHSTPPPPVPVVLKLETPDGKSIMVDGEHKCLQHLIGFLNAGEHVWLVGPKGTGKSHAARVARDALVKLHGADLPFYSMSVGPQSIQSDFFGFMFPNGDVYRTKFREWFEHGGIFCLDEIDAGSADVLTSLNSALANGWAMFPDGMVQIHTTSRMVATANTDGSGRTELYAGRTQQDGALIDRFAFMDWPIDEALEDKLVPNKGWLSYVRKAREAVATVNQAEISMRAAIKGSKSLAAGLPLPIVVRAYVAKGLSPEAMDVLKEVPLPKHV